jgi:hypothetical protein
VDAIASIASSARLTSLERSSTLSVLLIVRKTQGRTVARTSSGEDEPIALPADRLDSRRLV